MDSDPSSFPAGFAGQGLFLLRGVVALILLVCISSRSNGTVVHGLLIGASALIMAGLCTRWSALAALATIILIADWQTGRLLIAALTLALALTGPGSLSLDARLFGRRNIRLRPRNQDDA
ncbi:hypothetical protein E5A73_00915 [Sphingomonas gei]|uniref:Uncharacterized protein n=1 Tax=Sphingomonas gei TaxID=1395960 RepID=A0A4S1XI38_9SPHN|nr:hypothetical protein [Sphingomonas gei]TGX55725.1 hypothetical protein E5A73_00915 [Sphingomonas gei]